MTDSQRRALGHAKRAGAMARLTALGMLPAVAELWLAAWGGSTHETDDPDSFDFWERGAAWAAEAWTAGQSPPTIEQ